MKTRNLITRIGLSTAALALGLSVTLIGMASAQSNSTNATAATNSGSSSSTSKQQTIANILSKGSAEINRRETSLSNLNTRITGAKNLTSSDRSYLLDEVQTEESGLNNLKTTLAACTTVTCAATNAESIITEYRVYALVLPKVQLVRMADDQQVIETSLTTLTTKLQSRITNAQTAGDNVATLQTDLNTMIADINAAAAISKNIETTVLPLQPSDYDANHSVLAGDLTQLQTARTDLQNAAALAKTIITGLKSLGSNSGSTSSGSGNQT
jgi:hypothetical protein